MKVTDVLSPTLFWDVDTKNLDWGKNSQLIIERTLQRGLTGEVETIFKLYSQEKIKEAILKSKTFDKKNANYYSIKLNIPLSSIHVAPEHY